MSAPAAGCTGLRVGRISARHWAAWAWWSTGRGRGLPPITNDSGASIRTSVLIHQLCTAYVGSDQGFRYPPGVQVAAVLHRECRAAGVEGRAGRSHGFNTVTAMVPTEQCPYGQTPRNTAMGGVCPTCATSVKRQRWPQTGHRHRFRFVFVTAGRRQSRSDSCVSSGRWILPVCRPSHHLGCRCT